MVSKLPTLVEPTPIPSPTVGDDVGMRDLDLDLNMEDLAADLDTQGRQLGKRKASFSPDRPTPKIPRVVMYVDSSSDDEAGAGVEEAVI